MGDIWKFLLRMHASFAGIIGGIALFAGFNQPLADAKQYALAHDRALPFCYGIWVIIYTGKWLVAWKLRSDLLEVRRENRRKRNKR